MNSNLNNKFREINMNNSSKNVKKMKSLAKRNKVSKKSTKNAGNLFMYVVKEVIHSDSD